MLQLAAEPSTGRIIIATFVFPGLPIGLFLYLLFDLFSGNRRG